MSIEKNKSKTYIHGTKYEVIKNKVTGRVENIRCNYNYYREDREKEERKLKKEGSKGDYMHVSVHLR